MHVQAFDYYSLRVLYLNEYSSSQRGGECLAIYWRVRDLRNREVIDRNHTEDVPVASKQLLDNWADQ